MTDFAASVRRRFNDPDAERSLSARFRQGRWHMLLEAFPDLAEMRVLDIGGTVAHWVAAPLRPARTVVLNLAPEEGETAGVRALQGDACDPPSELRNERFDLVYSNSVIEHVGGFARRVSAAEHMRELAPRHWVQTPYRYFPVEPHWLFPGMQFLPVPAKAFAAEHWPFAWSRPSGRDAVRNVLSVELLTRTEMRYLFPDSDIAEERAFGLCKSLIALKR